MAIETCWNCALETIIVAPDFKCEHCGAQQHRYTQPENIQQVSPENSVLTPDELLHPVSESKSIRHKINLKKEPLAWQQQQQPEEKSSSTPIVEIPPLKPEIPKIEIPKAEIETPNIVIPIKEIPIFPEEPKKEYSYEDALKDKEAKERELEDFLQKNPPQPELPKEDPTEIRRMLEEMKERERKLEILLEEKEKEITAAKNLDSPIPEDVPKIPKVENPNPEKKGKAVVGWLIRHTENMPPVYYELFEGENLMGRPEKGKYTDIEILQDNYVSRAHALLYIFPVMQNLFVFELRDDGSRRDDKKCSLNGTYLNGNTKRILANEPLYLQDNDTIQVGVTKLVLKIRKLKQGIADASQEVLTSSYTQSVKL